MNDPIGAPFIGGSYQLPIIDFGPPPPTPGDAQFYILSDFNSEFLTGGFSALGGASFGIGSSGSSNQGGFAPGGAFGAAVGLAATNISDSGPIPGWWLNLFSPYGVYGSMDNYFNSLGAPGNFHTDSPPFFGPPQSILDLSLSLQNGHLVPSYQIPQGQVRQHAHREPIEDLLDSLLPDSIGRPFITDRGGFMDNRTIDIFGFVPTGPGRFPAMPPGMGAPSKNFTGESPPGIVPDELFSIPTYDPDAGDSF